MFVTTHVAAGALVGAAATRRAGAASGAVRRARRRSVTAAVAAGAGLASHIALDTVPHWGVADRFADGRDRRRFLRAAAVDGVAGAVLARHLVVGAPPDRRAVVASAIAGAVLLDLNKPAHELLGRSPFPRRVDGWHRAVQRERDRPGRLVAEVVAAIAGAALAHAVVARSPGPVPTVRTLRQARGAERGRTLAGFDRGRRLATYRRAAGTGDDDVVRVLPAEDPRG